MQSALRICAKKLTKLVCSKLLALELSAPIAGRLVAIAQRRKKSALYQPITSMSSNTLTGQTGKLKFSASGRFWRTRHIHDPADHVEVADWCFEFENAALRECLYNMAISSVAYSAPSHNFLSEIHGYSRGKRPCGYPC